MYVQVGVGIGGGVLIGGEVYRGAAAGEIGYLLIFDDDARRDGLGPFEHAAGGTAFARLGRRAAEAGESPVLLELAGGDPEAIDAEVVFAAADRGDATAQRILDELLQRLARGIASAITILNPSAPASACLHSHPAAQAKTTTAAAKRPPSAASSYRRFGCNVTRGRTSGRAEIQNGGLSWQP